MHEYKAVNKCLEASQMKIEGTGSNLPKSLYFENILLNFKFWRQDMKNSSLDQKLASYGPVCLFFKKNKVLLQHSRLIFLMYCL